MTQKVPPVAIILVLFLAMLWGGNAVALKIGMRTIAPMASAALRFSVSLLAIAAWGRATGTRLVPSAGERLPLLLIGVLFTVQIACFNWGTNLTYAGRAVVMLNTYPVFVAAIAHFVVPGDRLTPRRALGLAVAFAGIVFVFRESLIADTRSHLFGDLLSLVSGLLLAALIVATNRLVQTIDASRLLVAEMVVGVPAFFVLSILIEGGDGFGVSLEAVLAILYQGVVVGGFCFVAWTLLLRRYSPSRMSVFFFTTPLWGLGLGHLVLKEPVTVSLTIGAALVACGIYLANATR